MGAFGTALSQLLEGDQATMAMAGALAVLLAFVAANAQVTGILVIGCGLLLNLVALVLNNGMPVRGEALVKAGVVERQELPTISVTGSRHLEAGTDRLAVLGDVLPVPGVREVLSFGDLIVLVGAADAVRDVSRRRRRRWSADERAAYRSTMTQLKAVHDWGAAPRPVPDSGSQNSAKPDVTEPASIDLTSERRASRSRPLVAATHSK